MGEKQDKGDRRSWKNILINKRYQLRFTLFMVGLSTLLMLSLGYWVLREARKATTVGINNEQGRDCEEVAMLAAAKASAAVTPDAPAAGAGTAVGDRAAVGSDGDEQDQAGDEAAEEDDEAGDKAEAEAEQPEHEARPAAEQPEDEARPAGEEPGAGPAAGGEPGEGAEVERERPAIEVEIGTMEIEPPPVARAPQPPPMNQAVLEACRRDQVAKIAKLKSNYRRIQLVLLVFGGLMVLGLTLYGIKTTHKVAGPLYKVTLYFDKLRKGRYDRVYNLRKGDQLVEFYEQFKAAHAGVVTMQKKDIEVLRGLLDAAEKAELRGRSPEIAALLDDMRETLERKEKSLE